MELGDPNPNHVTKQGIKKQSKLKLRRKIMFNTYLCYVINTIIFSTEDFLQVNTNGNRINY